MISGIICVIAGAISVPIFIGLGANEDEFYLMGLIGSSIFIVGGLILYQLSQGFKSIREKNSN
jgi:hypothetical protein